MPSCRKRCAGSAANRFPAVTSSAATHATFCSRCVPPTRPERDLDSGSRQAGRNVTQGALSRDFTSAIATPTVTDEQVASWPDARQKVESLNDRERLPRPCYLAGTIRSISPIWVIALRRNPWINSGKSVSAVAQGRQNGLQNSSRYTKTVITAAPVTRSKRLSGQDGYR